MIRFLFGRPGCGKTHRILEAVREHITCGQLTYLIVPEQEVYTCERDLLSALPSDAGRFFEIVSFSRLCEQIAGRYGGRNLTALTAGTRSLLMWQTLRELSGTLTEYRSTADASLTALMLSAVDELAANSISPDLLSQAVREMDADTPLARKAQDIATVQAHYHAAVSELCGNDPADRLLRAATALESHSFFENSFVYIDSFTSFTAQEYAFLRQLFRQASAVTVTLGSDGRHSREIQFDGICDTARRLARLASDTHNQWEDEVLTTSHRAHAAELHVLERDLWNLERKEDQREVPDEDARGHVRLVEAETMYDEAEAAALHILEAVENGTPYGEIAVIVRDFSLWNGVLDAALEQYGIPYFVSTRTDLNTRPAARLLPCALRCISRNFQARDVMALLKTGLCGVSFEEIDLFEEYVRTWNIGGGRMLEDVWSMNPDGYQTELTVRGKHILDTANHVRSKVIPPLQALSLGLKTAADMTDECRALYTYLDTLSIRAQLTEQAKKELQLGRHREAGETARLWPFLCEALASLATTLPANEHLSPSEIETALSILLASTDIGSVPMRHNCVMVGSASLLRVGQVKVALVLGLCEGEFPAAVSDRGVFSEQDKWTLETYGIELSSRSDKQSSDELFFVYRAFTTPSDRLILSFSRQTVDGRLQSPSTAIKRVEFLLPYIKAESFDSSMVSADTDTSMERLPSLVFDGLPRSMMPDVLGTRLWLSQGKLQTYFRCPFSYYGKYILNLREPLEAKVGNAESGNFLHHVLDKFLSTTLDEQNRIRPLSEPEIDQLADEIIRAYLQDLCHGDISANGRLLHIFSRMRTVVLTLLHSIVEELTHSAFTPVRTEWSTYAPDGSGPSPMVLHLDKETDPSQLVELILGGVIDRVDLYRKDDQIYVRVIDYKSSKHEFSERSMIQDMNIQLLLYLFTLCSPQNRALFASGDSTPASVIPASAVYMSPEENKTDGHMETLRTGVILEDEDVLQAASPDGADFLPGVKIGKSGKPTGKSLYSQERMSDLEDTLKSLIQETAARMYGGCADRTPSESACQYCRMRSGCYLAVSPSF